jgi:hypothetical protein
MSVINIHSASRVTVASKRMTLALAACVAAITLTGTASRADPVLTLEGVCPGEITATVTEARGARLAALFFSRRPGETHIPPPYPCSGVILDLDPRTFRFIEYIETDESGTGRVTGTASPRACGGFLQVLVGSECEKTNVIRIPE